MRARSLATAGIIVLIILLILIVAPRIHGLESQISGFWTGNDAFLERAGLASYYLYIGPRESKAPWSRRQGFLVITDREGGTVTSQAIGISYLSLFRRWTSALRGHFSPAAPYNIKATIEYDDEAVMPEKVTLSFLNGTLTVRDSEKIYAFLTRDNETSLAANAMYDEGEGPGEDAEPIVDAY